MIQYILENSWMDADEAHEIQKRFNADYGKEKAAGMWIPFNAGFDKHGNVVAVNADHGETDKEKEGRQQ